MSISALIKQHPLVSYCLVTLAISWGGILLVVGGPGGIPGKAEQIEAMALFVMTALFAGPSITGVLMISIVRGRAGWRNLFFRMTNWRVGLRWYLIALLTAPIIFAAVSLGLSLASPQFLPGLLITNDKAAFLVFGISYGLIGGGFLEELGWTGFAIPVLSLRYNVVRTGLVAGFLWGAWHFVVIFWMSDPSGEIPLTLLLPIQLFSWLPAYRVLMVWVL